MVSEDSDQVRTGLPAIHGLRDLDDLEQTLTGPMETFVDHVHAARELLEAQTLRRPQRIRLEEGMTSSRRSSRLCTTYCAMCSRWLSWRELPYTKPAPPKKSSKVFQAMPAAGTLRHHEPVCDLIAELVGASAPSAGLAHETN